MGRNKSAVWKYFDKVDNMAKCKFCSKAYYPNINKISKHLINCFKCPADIKADLNSEQSGHYPAKCVQKVTNIFYDTPQRLDQANVKSEDPPKPLSTAENESLNKMLARAIYVSGSPLSLVEHPLWTSFFARLEPSLKLPSRKQLFTNYLDEEYKSVKRNIAEQLHNAQNLHLQYDGWSNIRNGSIINFIISKPDPVFVDFLITEDNRHTGEYLHEQMKIIMEKHQPEKFFVVIGDNAVNMQKAFRLLKNSYSHIVPLGCIAHTLHLCCNDIIKCSPVKIVIEKATAIVQAINNSHLLRALLNKINKEKGIQISLKLPSKTRWRSYVFCLESLVSNRVSLQTLAVSESSSLTRDMKITLLDEDCFWNDILVLIEIIKPIVVWITKFDSNNCLIHKVHYVIKELKTYMFSLLQTDKVRLLQDFEKKQLYEKFEERMHFVESPIYLAAALLDPSNQGYHLNDTDQITAMEFIYEVSRNMGIEVMTDLALYRTKEGIWGKEFLWSSVSSMEPLNWWKGLCANKNLSKIAARILSAPVTSVATERSFSTFSWIQSKKRNRFTTERAGKLACISHNWNIELHTQMKQRNKAEKGENELGSGINISGTTETTVEPSCSYNADIPSTSKSIGAVKFISSENIFTIPSDSSDSD